MVLEQAWPNVFFFNKLIGNPSFLAKIHTFSEICSLLTSNFYNDFNWAIYLSKPELDIPIL